MSKLVKKSFWHYLAECHVTWGRGWFPYSVHCHWGTKCRVSFLINVLYLKIDLLQIALLLWYSFVRNWEYYMHVNFYRNSENQKNFTALPKLKIVKKASILYNWLYPILSKADSESITEGWMRYAAALLIWSTSNFYCWSECSQQHTFVICSAIVWI